MNGQELDLPWPTRGRDDSRSAVDQPLGTTPEAQDVVTRNPRTGRHGGATRGGLEPYCSVSLGASGPRAMADVVADTRSSNYDELATPETAWEADGPSGRETRAVRTDAEGNVYGLEGGTHVVVRNLAGVEIESIALPVQSTGQRCHALAIDPGSRTFFVGSSEGGSQARAKLWAYTRDAYDGWRILWELEPNAYVAKLVLHNGLLHAGLNDTLRGRSYVVSYSNVGTLAVELWRSQVPAPVTGLAINAEGRIAVCSGANSQRGYDPRFGGAGQMIDETFRSYWLDNIANYSGRVWCVLDPAELDLLEGDSVFEWADKEGSNRKLIPANELIHVEQHAARLRLASGSNADDGDTLTLTAADGSSTEVWTFRTTPTTTYEVARGSNWAAALLNLEAALLNGVVSLSTPPSSLAYLDGERLRAFSAGTSPVQPVVIATCTSASSRFNFSEIEGGNSTTARLQREANVQPTPPKFRRSGMSGRPAVVFDGISSKLVTPTNVNKAPSDADEQSTLFPGYGINYTTASSARFALFMVCKPDPQHVKAIALGQRVDLSGGSYWLRRLVSNRGTDGAYSEGQLGAVERDNTTMRTHSADYGGAGGVANFSMVSWISNPTGDYEMYYNGEEMDNATATHIGTAVANDSIARTTLGQTSLAGKYEDRFWAGEVNLIVAVHLGNGAPMTVAERQLYEGAIAWYFGAQAKLPTTHPYYSTPPPAPDGTVSDFHLSRRALSPYPNLTVLDGKTRDIAWIAASPETGVGTVSGLGTGVAWLSTGDLVSMGVPANVSEDIAAVRLVVDDDDDYSLGWSWDMGVSGVDTWTFDGLEIAVDEWDNAYVPWHAERTTIAGAPPQYLVFDKDGTVLLQPAADNAQASFSIALAPRPEFNDETIQRAESVVVGLRRENTSLLSATANPADGDQVTFAGTISGSPYTETYTFAAVLAGPNDVLIGASLAETLANLKAAINLEAGSGTAYDAGTARSLLVSAVDAQPTSLKIVARTTLETSALSATFVVSFDPETFTLDGGTMLRSKLVALVAELGEGRLRQRVAVVDQNIVVFGADYVQTTTGGASVVDVNARYVHSRALGKYVFTTDGVKSWATDIRKRTTELFTSKSAGDVPTAAPIFEAYRARLVALAGSRIFWSAVLDPFNWDYKPEVVQPSQAWNSGLPPSFDIDDVLNGFASISDDLAIVLGDHSIWRQTGDPGPGGNGQCDVLTRSIGGAFGRAWCIGPGGELYFWTSEGELAVIVGGSQIQPISGARMREVFRAVDLSKNYMRLAWNVKRDELDIFACPYGGEAGSGRWFSWERGVDALWENEFQGRVVTDVIEIDADNPGDSAVVLGMSDGRVRKLSDTATTDDGVDIRARVRIGPIAFRDSSVEAMLPQLQVILDAQGGDAFVEVWSSDAASDFGNMRWRGTLRPGVSPVHRPRVSGGYLWFVLHGVGGWGFEKAVATIQGGSVRRRRVAR